MILTKLFAVLALAISCQASNITESALKAGLKYFQLRLYQSYATGEGSEVDRYLMAKDSADFRILKAMQPLVDARDQPGADVEAINSHLAELASRLKTLTFN